MIPLSCFVETQCSCDSCKRMCTNPCIPTPEEAINLLNLFGLKLESRGFYSDEIDDNIRVILPVIRYGACVFLDSNNLCTLHNKGLKPLEGRLAIHSMTIDKSPHEAILELWQIDPNVSAAFDLLETIKERKC